MNIGRKIYFDVVTGNLIKDTGEIIGGVPSTVEQDIAIYSSLSERNRDTFDVIELEYGQYTQDFAECTSYRVNPETRQLEFSYEPIDEDNEPIYRAPLSEEVEQLKKDNALLKAQKQALSEQVDFHEELIVELATQVYV